MAYDERARRNLGVWRGWMDTSALRWDRLGEAWRGTTDPVVMATELMTTVRDQVIDNLDSWNAIWFETGDPLPSVIVTGTHASMAGSVGIATVGPRLTGLALDGTALEELGGSHTIPGTGSGGYTVVPTGEYDGRVQVTMVDDVATAGTYRGLLRYVPTGGADPEPLAWLFVVAA